MRRKNDGDPNDDQFDDDNLLNQKVISIHSPSSFSSDHVA